MFYIASVAICPEEEAIAARVREARDRLGLTQAALGEKLGVTWHTVSRWERGKKLPELQEVFALARLIECPVAWFFPTGQAEAEISPLQALDILRKHLTAETQEKVQQQSAVAVSRDDSSGVFSEHRARSVKKKKQAESG